MTKKELLEELEGCADHLEISFSASIPPDADKCRCGGYCYCSYQEFNSSITQLSKKTEYNKKTKQQDVVGLVLVG